VSSSVVVKALVGEVPALALKALEVITSLVPVPAVTVSTWVALVSDPDAVRVGAPALVSP
jgi:hypothetical protein